MKNLQKWLLAVLLLLGFAARGKAAEIFKNDDLDFSIGGRIQELGEMELVTDDAIRNHYRIYLWNAEDRLYSNGTFKGFKWNFEASFGGEDIANGTNGSFNLLDANVDVPIIPDMIYVKVGQFKDAANLESATYEGSQLFTEKSPHFNLFFNEGYDTGVALWGRLGNLDGAAGMVQGAPNLPQRYLPELVNFPIPMFARVGFSDGIQDDFFKPQQTGFAKPDKLQWAVHLEGFAAADSNAGHSNLFGQIGGGLATFNDNSYYGNVLTSSKFNPYLSVAGQNPVTAFYGQAGLDFQVRTPMGDTTFTLSGQAMLGHYDMTVPSFTIPNTTPGKINGVNAVPGSKYALNIGGGELIASVGDNPWEIAGRFVVVVPDDNLRGTANDGTTYRSIFVNSNPIYEVTLPSITWHMNEQTKLVAETMFMFDTVESQDTDGNYVVAEMPGSATGTTYRAPNIRAGFVPVGRMMFQFSF
ncbi:MAG TPA: hypothetical protein VHE12_00930 [bacterium]|nr:hypothetical protein [bacterium]